jgi:hypothetical protein
VPNARPRIEPEHERVGLRRLAPRGHDPELVADRDRAELRLREPNPVAVGDRARLVQRHGRVDRARHFAEGRVDIGAFREQRLDARDRPERRGGAAGSP